MKKKVDWYMKVLERKSVGSFEAALMKGHPSDLCFYEFGREPSEYVFFWKKGVYYKIDVEKGKSGEAAIPDEKKLSSMATGENLILVSDLKKGSGFGMQGGPRDDGMYMWQVTEEREYRFSEKGFSTFPGKIASKEYLLSYKTNSDSMEYSFVPQLGITGFVFSHRGTVSEVEISLVEYKAK